MKSLEEGIRSVAGLHGHFLLRSGKISDTYFDKYQFESDPALLMDIATSLAAVVPPGTEVLAGLEMGGIPVVTMLRQVTGLPAAFIRKKRKDYGTCRHAEGATLTRRRFVLVEDVVTSGGAILDALSLLEADGLRPETAPCVIDRSSGGSEALTRIGLPLHALLTFRELGGTHSGPARV